MEFRKENVEKFEGTVCDSFEEKNMEEIIKIIMDASEQGIGLFLWRGVKQRFMVIKEL